MHGWMFMSNFFSDLEQDGFFNNPLFHGIITEVPEQHKTKESEGDHVTLSCHTHCFQCTDMPLGLSKALCC